MGKPIRVPSYRLHAASGLARVRINGNSVYLGEFNSLQSRKEYDALIDNWLASQNVDKFTLTLKILALKYVNFAKKYYVKNGEPTSEQGDIKIALRFAVRRSGSLRVADFGPVAFKAIREDMIKHGLVRTSINSMMGRITRMIKWGVEEEIVDVEIWQKLKAVLGLGFGRRDDVEESAPVEPVDLDRVKAVEPYLSHPVWAMVMVQLLTAARPGEVTQMRTCDIDRKSDVWEYRPQSHKRQHHAKSRTIMLGPEAQKIVTPFLRPDSPDMYLFSPREGRRDFDANRSANRQTPMTPSQAKRKRKKAPKKSPGQRYTSSSYGQAVRKACEKAWDMPKHLRIIGAKAPADKKAEWKLAAAEWRKQYCWAPNQLRHTKATEIRAKFDLEYSQVVLEHAHSSTTEIYAERDREKARHVMRLIG